MPGTEKQMASTQANGQNEMAERRALAALVQQMELDAQMEDTDPMAAIASGVEAILSAETEQEMWDADERGPLGGRDLADVELRILSYGVRFSRANIGSRFVGKNGREMYVMVEATRYDNGAHISFNTSAPYLVAKIVWLDRHNKLPADAVIRATDLGAGQAVLKLKPLSKRPVPASAA